MNSKRRGNGEGTITQRNDGRWVALMQTGYDGGKRQRKAFYGRTREEAAKKLTAALSDLNKGIKPVENARMTLGAFLLDEWLPEKQKRQKPSTYRGYESKVRVHIVPALGTVPLAKLTTQKVEAFLDAKSDAGHDPLTVHHLRAILRAAMTTAIKRNYVHQNVVRATEPIPHEKEFKDYGRVPDATEAMKMIEAAKTDRLGALYTLCMTAGLRQGEALALHWRDVDLEAGTAKINHTLAYVGGEFTLTLPKTSKSRGEIALPAVAVDALDAHRRRQSEEAESAGSLWEENDLVFSTATGRPLQGSAVTRSFQDFLKKSGFAKMRFHDLRHACGSLLLAQKVHMALISATLRHSRIETTINIYAHVSPELKREAAAEMDAALAAAR